MDLETATKRLQRQLSRGAYSKARLTFLWLYCRGGGTGKTAVRLRRILREAPASAFLQFLYALDRVLGFLHPRSARAGFEALETLAEQGEPHAVLFLAGRLVRRERLPPALNPSVTEKDRACRWLAPLVEQGYKEAAPLLELLRPLPSIEELMEHPFPGPLLQEIGQARQKAARKLIRWHRAELAVLRSQEDTEQSSLDKLPGVSDEPI